MLTVTVHISGTKEVKAKIKKLGQSFYMFKSAMDSIGKEVENYSATVAYTSQGGVFGTPWARLSSYYALRKAKRYPGRPPLVATGRMQNKYYHEATNESVIIGNKAPQFKYHQSTLPRHKIPRRATIGVNTPVKLIVESILQQDVKSKISKAGF